MNAKLNLPPSVEERLSGWMRIQERRAKAPDEFSGGLTLTLSRAYGCEGFPLAVRIQERLNAAQGGVWSVFDKALIEKVALDEGISLRLLRDLGDESRSLEAFGFHPRGLVTNDEAFAKVAAALVEVARQGHAIIVGRGGAVLCHDLPNAFHFRLEASHAWRVDAIMRRTGASRAEAETQLKQASRIRDQFIQERLGADVTDRRYYDAVFNNERHSLDAIADAIVAYISSAARV